MMRSKSPSYVFHKLKIGFQNRCPECEQGRIFARRFQINAMCPYCHSRFERSSGDAIGGVYINVALAEFTAMTGFFITQWLFEPSVTVQLAIWLPFILIFCIAFYRPTRGLWVGIMYLTGGIYPDPDYMREYIAPQTLPMDRTPHEPQEDS